MCGCAMLPSNFNQLSQSVMTGKFAKDQAVHLIGGDTATQEKVVSLLKQLPINVKIFFSVEAFLAEPLSHTPACLIVDTMISDADAAVLTKDMRRHGLSTPIVVLADGEHSIATAISALRVGATDFFEKPIRDKDFLERIKTILKSTQI